MKLDSPLESLILDLEMIEIKLKEYHPPICSTEAKFLDLLDKREQYKCAIFHLKSLKQIIEIYDINHGFC
jgi:chorismate mutase